MPICPNCGHNWKNETGELRKQAKDRKRAESAIAALGAWLARGGEQEQMRAYNVTVSSDCAASLRTAAEDELERLIAIVDNPEALRMIYRRNEVRK